MHEGLPRAMAEAARLARTGRLHEAAALIQRTLRGGAAPDLDQDTPTAAHEPIDAEFTVVAVEPPEPTRRADRSAGAAEAAGSPDKQAASGAAPPPEPALLDTLRRTLQSALGTAVPGLGPDRANPDIFAGGRFIEGSYAHEAGSRAYKLYIPSRCSGQAPPLVVMLHGCTQEPDDFAAGTRMNVLAEREGFCVVYPEQAASANPQRCWNWFKASDQHRGQGEPALLAGLTREIVRAHRLDARRVYVAGLSAGGAMAMVLGVNYPDLYAAIGVHSGLPYKAAHDLPSALAAMQRGEPNPPSPHQGKAGGSASAIRPVPAIVFHGDRDTTVHPGNGDQVLAQWAKAHSRGSTGAKLRVTEQRGQAPGGHRYTRALYRGPDGRVVLERWRIHGAGHAWSGGSPKGSYTDPKGPEASVEMARFFLGHALGPA